MTLLAFRLPRPQILPLLAIIIIQSEPLLRIELHMRPIHIPIIIAALIFLHKSQFIFSRKALMDEGEITNIVSYKNIY